jgi:gamma-glutamyltranspeptidase/glutathione hydrolase
MNGGTMDRADMIHYQVGAKKLAFEDRIAHLDDPAFGDPKISMLISKEYAARRRQRLGETAPRSSVVAVPSSSDTTFLCAADRDGNAISLIQSIFAPFGSRVVAGETGVIMNNRLCSFGLDPAKANSLVPGKRPAHTLNTYMILLGDGFFAAGGSPGADDQPQTNLQVIHNLLDCEMNPQSAVEAPRWSHQPGTPPRDQLPEELRMEDGFNPDVVEALRDKGHKISVVDRWSFGSAKVIVHDATTGTWMAGADPRREAYALAW